MKHKYQDRLMKILSILLTFSFMFIYISSEITPNNNANAVGAPVIDTLAAATIAVSSVAVTSATTKVIFGRKLQMSTLILPANATDKKVVWSVVNATGSATITVAGLLTAKKVGTVTVIAKDITLRVKGMKVITVTAVPLKIAIPTLTIRKVYNRTRTAVVKAGALIGVVAGYPVTVTATATYNTVNVGSGKKIIVVYKLAGLNAANYIKPVNYSVLTGVITVKPLKIAAPVLTTTKIYNGTTTAVVKAGK